ncbi:DUF3788 domain-containing protein [Enterococcus sp. LJL120]
MLWSEKYTRDIEPTPLQVKNFINNPLFEELDHYLQDTYKIKAKKAYSGCSMDQGIWKGWNIKYQKKGRSICTLYPQDGYVLALLPLNHKELAEAETLLPTLSNETQEIYKIAKVGHNGKSLPLKIQSESTVKDVKQIVSLRIHE